VAAPLINESTLGFSYNAGCSDEIGANAPGFQHHKGLCRHHIINLRVRMWLSRISRSGGSIVGTILGTILE